MHLYLGVLQLPGNRHNSSVRQGRLKLNKSLFIPLPHSPILPFFMSRVFPIDYTMATSHALSAHLIAQNTPNYQNKTAGDQFWISVSLFQRAFSLFSPGKILTQLWKAQHSRAPWMKLDWTRWGWNSKVVRRFSLCKSCSNLCFVGFYLILLPLQAKCTNSVEHVPPYPPAPLFLFLRSLLYRCGCSPPLSALAKPSLLIDVKWITTGAAAGKSGLTPKLWSTGKYRKIYLAVTGLISSV